MRRELIPESMEQYKTNLHCHTVYSDGKLTPQQVKELYMSRGYSAVAFTDHDIFVPHGELKSEDFIPLNGYEIEITEEGNDFDLLRTCHLCFISLDEDNITPVCLHHGRYMFGGVLEQFGEMAPFEGDMEREYTPECVNSFIAAGKRAGFFVTYNHPVWSLESYPEYSKYRGMDAVEMFNYLSVVEGYDEFNHRVYDDMLRLGLDIGCTGSDDNHNSDPQDMALDSCGAWNMLCAGELSYKSLAGALESGMYYASMGPSIYSLYVEDGIARVRTSDAAGISFSTATRHSGKVNAPEGETVNEGAFRLHPTDGYFRVTVEDRSGKRACTRGYRLDTWDLPVP